MSSLRDSNTNRDKRTQHFVLGSLMSSLRDSHLIASSTQHFVLGFPMPRRRRWGRSARAAPRTQSVATFDHGCLGLGRLVSGHDFQPGPRSRAAFARDRVAVVPAPSLLGA